MSTNLSSNKTTFSITFVYINFGIHVWYLLQLKHIFWHACNTILKFSMQHISFTHWPWMMPAPWNHINDIINIPKRLKFDYNSIIFFHVEKIYPSFSLLMPASNIVLVISVISVLAVPLLHYIRNQFVYTPSQWEATLHCNVVCHWLGAYTKWILLYGITCRTDYALMAGSRDLCVIAMGQNCMDIGNAPEFTLFCTSPWWYHISMIRHMQTYIFLFRFLGFSFIINIMNISVMTSWLNTYFFMNMNSINSLITASSLMLVQWIYWIVMLNHLSPLISAWEK